MEPTRRILTYGLLAIVAACGGGGDVEDCAAQNQDQALACLGVATDSSPRIDRTGLPLPAAYAPLGAKKRVGGSREIFMLGMQLAPPVPVGEPTPLSSRAVLLGLEPGGDGTLSPTVLDTQPEGTPWESDSTSNHPGSLSSRDAAAPDLDGDGIDDTIVAFLDTEDPVNTGVVFFEAVGSGVRQPVVTVPGVHDVVLRRADTDGDGNDELVLGVTNEVAGLIFVIKQDEAGRFAVVEAGNQQLPRITAGGSASIEIAVGNLDRDSGEEIAAVLNENQTSSYAIFDDATGGYASVVTDGAVRIQDGGNFEAKVADVAIGDVDGDGKGELVFAGLGELPGDSCTAYQHLYLVLDDIGDAPAPLAPLAQRAEDIRYVPSSGCDEITVELPVHHVFVNTLDVDGDGVMEIQANLRIFGDLRMGVFAERYAIDPAVLANVDGRGGSALARATTAFAVADVSGNGRDEIVVFGQHMDRVVVWGLDGPSLDSAEFRQMLELKTAFYNSQTRVFPVIVPVNSDRDGAVLQYSDAEYRFVFTEPVIIAAVAAPPCADGIGQNIGACTSAYGASESSMGGADGNVTVSASAFVSFEAKDPFFGIGVEGKKTVTASASFSAAQSYSLEESVEYTTGSMEDTVIFTTVPLDQFTYTIVSHPDPELVGQKIVVNLPRSPVTLQVEREFYNRSVTEDSFKVDSNVFLHRVGEIDSYPTEDDADVLIDTGGLAHIGPLGELVDAAGEALGPLAERLLGRGIKSSRTITVGQGTGQTAIEIAFSESTEYRAGAEIAYETELAVTGGGVAVGGSVGASAGAGISWGTSSSTVYRGTIGSIEEASFADNLYSVGLFTYVYNYGNREAPQFEVINYWVER